MKAYDHKATTPCIKALMIQSSRALKALAFCLVVASAGAFAIKPTKEQRSLTTAMKSSDDSQPGDLFQPQTWNPLRLLVLKLGLTEPAWTSPWNYQKKLTGTFLCAYCGKELFDANFSMPTPSTILVVAGHHSGDRLARVPSH